MIQNSQGNTFINCTCINVRFDALNLQSWKSLADLRQKPQATQTGGCDILCNHCNARLTIRQVLNRPDLATTVMLECPNKTWYDPIHDKATMQSSDGGATFWTENVSSPRFFKWRK